MQRPQPATTFETITKDAITLLEFARGKLRRNQHKQHVHVTLPARHQGENSQLMGTVMHRHSEGSGVMILYVTDKDVWVGRSTF